MKSIRQNILRIAVFLSVLLSFVPVFVPQDTYATSEIVEKRTENSKTYDLGNGKYSIDISGGAIHYKDNYADSKEQWKDIDLTWVGNRITKAPYELTLENNRITVRDKKTGDVSIIELLSTNGKIKTLTWTFSRGLATASSAITGIGLEVVASTNSISFTHILPDINTPFEAKFVVVGKIPLETRAFDDEGEITFETSLVDGILTEKLSGVIDKRTGKVRPAKGSIRIDPTLDLQVGASSDDCYRKIEPSYFSLTDLDMASGDSTDVHYDYSGGMRFTGVTIPQGASINVAYISLYAVQLLGTIPTTYINGEAADNAVTFVDAANYDGRARTTASTTWTPSAWVINTWYNSSSIVSVIQEIINRAGWASGNALVIFWRDNSGWGGSQKWVAARSYDGSTTYAPKLHIEYTPPPAVTTNAATNVEATTATLNGNVTAINDTSITERGFDWDTDSGAPYANSWTEAGSWSTGVFSYSGGTFNTGTTYYFRAKAKNNTLNWGYGSELTFLTKPAAPTNVAATDGTWTDKVVITWTKSTGATGYRVYRDSVDVSGLLGDVATYDDTGASAGVITPGTASATDGTSGSLVTLSIAGESVANGTTHTYKVVASNATGNSADSVTNTGYRGVGAITYAWQRSAADSDAAYSAIGGATTDPYDDAGAPDPVITPGTGDASDGTSVLHVVLSVAGESVADGAGRWYYCIVSATGCTSQDTNHNRGYQGAQAMTYAWQRSAADSDATFSSIAGEGGTTDPYNDTNGVVDPDGRWYYCILSSTGASNADTTHNRGYKAAADPPDVTTGACTGFIETSAIVNGTMTDDDIAACTKWGFDYGLTGAYGSSVEVIETLSDGDTFSYNLTGLSPATVYHYRAKAYSTEGWGYGSDDVFSTKGSPVKHTYCEVASDNQTTIYGANWVAQTFTTPAEYAYTITEVQLNLIRTGTAGTLTAQIKRASAGVPTGNALCSGTLSGALVSTSAAAWYSITMTAETALEANATYAIVLSDVTAASSVNCVSWRFVNAGGCAGGSAATSSDMGLAWTTQTYDLNYAIWGNPCLDIQDVKIFTGYQEADDWLIAVRYLNTYPPYYDTYDPKKYFMLQLSDNTTVVKAQVAMPQWGNRVGSIYLNKAMASSLNYGGDYRIRIYGNFSGNPYFEYAITSADWMGSDLTRLDSWVITSATVIGDYYSKILTTYIAGRGEVLNTEGGALMSSGINGLSLRRPNIFQTYSSTGSVPEGTFTQAGRISMSNWQAHIGADGVVMATRLGNVLGIDGGAMLSIIFLLVSFGIAIFGFSPGHTTAAMILCLIPLIGAVAFGVDMIIIGILVLVAAFLFVKRFWLDTGQ